MKKEVNRLKADDKVSITVIDLLNKKIHQQMEVIVNAMPDHLKSIPYEGDPKKDFNMARKNCHAIKNLLDAAEQIDKSLVYRYGEEICEMMMKSFSRDVREIKTSCLKHINLEQNEQLITGIKDLREEIVKPFFNRVSLYPDKHCNKIQANTTKAINELAKTHNPASNLNNEARTDSAVKGKTKTPLLQQNPHSNTLLDLQPAAQGDRIGRTIIPIIGYLA
ncbi:hypothetical protein, partial [Endozoicomonas sp. ONNA2]|uniref:hypothetical protein n=1 Tax=Endozoicomonas sp. ONNA2 TaxID=2828741 RepID=UPI002148C8EF